jgi:hypothetical protein
MACDVAAGVATAAELVRLFRHTAEFVAVDRPRLITSLRNVSCAWKMRLPCSGTTRRLVKPNALQSYSMAASASRWRTQRITALGWFIFIALLLTAFPPERLARGL